MKTIEGDGVRSNGANVTPRRQVPGTAYAIPEEAAAEGCGCRGTRASIRAIQTPLSIFCMENHE